jgi:hypothetical protein
VKLAYRVTKDRKAAFPHYNSCHWCWFFLLGGTLLPAYFSALPVSNAERLAEHASALLAAMPLDTVPPPAPLPCSSRMPIPTNPLFVGRHADLLTLANALANKHQGCAGCYGHGRYR